MATPERTGSKACIESPKNNQLAAVGGVAVTIGLYDVLCGRNKIAFNNIGNRRFRVMVSIWLNNYVNVAKRRKEKSQIVRSIIASTKACGGRFLQEREGVLVELSDREAHVKVGHAIRDMATNKQKSDSNAIKDILCDESSIERMQNFPEFSESKACSSDSGHSDNKHVTAINDPWNNEWGRKKAYAKISNSKIEEDSDSTCSALEPNPKIKNDAILEPLGLDDATTDEILDPEIIDLLWETASVDDV